MNYGLPMTQADRRIRIKVFAGVALFALVAVVSYCVGFHDGREDGSRRSWKAEKWGDKVLISDSLGNWFLACDQFAPADERYDTIEELKHGLTSWWGSAHPPGVPESFEF